MDDFISLFVEEFGEPEIKVPVPTHVVSKYTGVAPDSLINYWKAYGFSSFGNGIVWMTNPDDYVTTLRLWFGGIRELNYADFIVFCRTAFGEMFALNVKSGHVVNINPLGGFVMGSRDALEKSRSAEDSIRSFFATLEVEDLDILDENDSPLFDRAVKKLGGLAESEIYGFEPMLVLGGSASIQNVMKLRMDVHLDIMRNFTEPVLRLI